jgi:hypothetical protein
VIMAIVATPSKIVGRRSNAVAAMVTGTRISSANGLLSPPVSASRTASCAEQQCGRHLGLAQPPAFGKQEDRNDIRRDRGPDGRQTQRQIQRDFIAAPGNENRRKLPDDRGPAQEDQGAQANPIVVGFGQSWPRLETVGHSSSAIRPK